MKTIFKVVPVVLALSTILGGCAVYAPPPAYSQGYAPAPVYYEPAPLYMYPPVSFGFGYRSGYGRHRGGGGHRYR
jgi:hypothetical protein